MEQAFLNVANSERIFSRAWVRFNKRHESSIGFLLNLTQLRPLRNPKAGIC